ncbi:MAG: glycosyltransferase family 2 protein [Myxococcota bacterium]|nr:glycosyltransferase family 2 protein [Myxococcota bacterium]
MKICALVPVYNNAGTITDVISRCRAAIEPDILVVSDGSTDQSDDRARATGVEVIALRENRGKGAAIRVGLEAARERGYSHAIVLDADGQHLPEEIPKFYELSLSFPDRIGVGVRRMTNKDVPKASRRGRSISNFWTSLASWQRCKDAQCGFRVYPIEETLALGCKEPGFQFEMEILVKAAWSGMRIAHTDIDVIYPPKEVRVSHFDPRRDNLKFTWLSMKLFFGMLFRLPQMIYRKIRGF